MATTSPPIVQLQATAVVSGAVARATLDVTTADLAARGVEWQRESDGDPSVSAVVSVEEGAPLIGLEGDADPAERGVYLMAHPEVDEGEITRVLDVLGVGPEQAVDPVSGQFIASSGLPRHELILKAVTARPGITVRELAEALGINAGGSLYTMLNALVADRLMEKRGPRLEPRPAPRRRHKANQAA